MEVDKGIVLERKPNRTYVRCNIVKYSIICKKIILFFSPFILCLEQRSLFWVRGHLSCVRMREMQIWGYCGCPGACQHSQRLKDVDGKGLFTTSMSCLQPCPYPSTLTHFSYIPLLCLSKATCNVIHISVIYHQTFLNVHMHTYNVTYIMMKFMDV
jgi:hypothetical protein